MPFPLQRSSRFLVTGGCGAIGSRLIRRLLADGAERVVAVDDLSSGYEWLLPADPRIEFIQADVCGLLDQGPLLETPTVFHLAAFFANQNSVDYPLADLHTNARGTLTALLWAKANRARRLVYASAGCSIAGHGVDAPVREDMPVSLDLDTPYQITKALGEFYCNYFNREVSTVRCRFFNSYGPGEAPGYYRNVIPNFIWRALHDRPLVITGTGDETRDFIFVEDLVDGLARAADRPAAGGEAFNLGTGIETRIGDLAEWVIGACRSASGIEYAPRRKWDHSVHRRANVDKSREILGLEARTGVTEGIGRTIEWFLEHKEQIERLAAARAVAV